LADSLPFAPENISLNIPTFFIFTKF
jgi:hypothetical protein